MLEMIIDVAVVMVAPRIVLAFLIGAYLLYRDEQRKNKHIQARWEARRMLRQTYQMDRVTIDCEHMHGRSTVFSVEAICPRCNEEIDDFYIDRFNAQSLAEYVAQYERTGLTAEQVAQLADALRDGRLVIAEGGS